MYIRLVYQPNYSNTKEYNFIPALDVNEQLTIPGRVGCSTQPLKFVMNGSLLLGSKDSTNLRIHHTLGENVVVLFGQNYYDHRGYKYKKCEKLS
jgi:glucan phosphorylase